MNTYIIHGAGAVGSAIGGLLAKIGFDVIFIARKAHVDAIKKQNGIYLKTLDKKILQPVKAYESFNQFILPKNPVIFQTIKANDTENSLEDLKNVPKDTPIVCWQNGIGSESIISSHFKNVYGGVVRFTATYMVPGETNFAGTGKLILGAYPKGKNKLTEEIAKNLNICGFNTIISDNIMQDKWLKLLINLISCVKPITIKDSHEETLRKQICKNVLKEGINVLNKAGIKATSTNKTEDEPEDMLKKFDTTMRFADGKGQNMNLKNSTWQSLAKKKKSLENDMYTGTIINLGEKYSVPVPYNKAVLHYIHLIAEKEYGPNSIKAENIIKMAES